MGAMVVITTVGTEEQAYVIAEELVRRRHSCCVNIIPGIRSVYRWKGKVSRDSEYMLIAKTLESEFEQLADAIRELHSYELPEIVSFKMERGDPDFMSWIEDSLDKTRILANGEEDESSGFGDDSSY